LLSYYIFPQCDKRTFFRVCAVYNFIVYRFFVKKKLKSRSTHLPDMSQIHAWIFSLDSIPTSFPSLHPLIKLPKISCLTMANSK